MGPLETPRLVLRCWHPDDAPLLAEAVFEDTAFLARWLPWAEHEPITLGARRELLGGFRARHLAGEEYFFAVTRADEVLGGVGLHRPTADAEIGYWLRRSATGRGYATEAVRAVLNAAMQHGLGPFMIRHDPNNLASAGVPQRLGFEQMPSLDGSNSGGRAATFVVWRGPKRG